MNKRIKELLDQSGLQAYYNAQDDQIEKFAKLIVQECMNTILDQTTLDTNEDFREGFSHGRKLSWQEIRTKFGFK